MRVRYHHYGSYGYKFVREMSLDEVAVYLGEDMMSVAWDRDAPDLSPSPSEFSKVPNMYAGPGTWKPFPPRIFHPDLFQSRGDVCLAYIDGCWSWRGNPIMRRIVWRGGDTVIQLPHDSSEDHIVYPLDR